MAIEIQSNVVGLLLADTFPVCPNDFSVSDDECFYYAKQCMTEQYLSWVVAVFIEIILGFFFLESRKWWNGDSSGVVFSYEEIEWDLF